MELFRVLAAITSQMRDATRATAGELADSDLMRRTATETATHSPRCITDITRWCIASPA